MISMMTAVRGSRDKIAGLLAAEWFFRQMHCVNDGHGWGFLIIPANFLCPSTDDERPIMIQDVLLSNSRSLGGEVWMSNDATSLALPVGGAPFLGLSGL